MQQRGKRTLQCTTADHNRHAHLTWLDLELCSVDLSPLQLLPCRNMATDQEKLSKFFAKQDRKIQINGYITINEIANKKHSRIQSVKMGSNKTKNNDDVNKSVCSLLEGC